MRMTARDGSLDLFAEVPYRRGSSRKPPRPLARRRRCLSEDVNRRSSSGLQQLTTFQKLDREMGRFVKEQSGCVHASEEDSSVRGVRRGVKWKCGWMFEQDSLYWETVRRQDVSGGEAGNFSSRCAHGADGLKEHHDSGASTCDSSTPVELEGSLQQHCSTDHESVSSGMELHLRRSRRTRRQAEVESVAGQGQEKKNGDGEETRVHPSAEKGWPAVLKAKCEVLQMEKELADQRLRQQCAEMAQAAQMAHCLRASVQTILETAKRGTVSAPCTPGRQGQEDYSPCLQQRIQRLQTVNVQRDLEDQAKRFQNRIDTLRLQSQIRSADTSFQNDGRLCKTRLSSTSSTTQVLTTDGEDWAQVQEVLKQLRGKTGSLQHNCENWEKRALFAESKAASLQIEEENWRIEAQRSAEKVRELERELFQLRSTLEEVRNRHALEQSRLLGSGSNHGYTLVLQPIVTTSQGSCRCTPNSRDNNEPCSTCGSTHCHSSTGNHHTAVNLHDIEPPPPEAAVPKDAEVTSENGDEICAADESPQDPVSLNVQVDTSSSQNHSPERDEEASETTSGTTSVQSRHRYEGALEAEGDDMSPCLTPEKSQGQQFQSTTTAHEPASKTEVERSLSQKWFKQRPKSRRPGSSALGLEMSISESTRSNLGNSPIPAKALHRGRGASNHAGFSAGGALQKPGPVYAGSTRVSSPSLLEKRVPLREIKRNSTASNGDVAKSECV